MKRIWKTKSGQRLKIKEMTTKHIKNCINLLHRYHSAKLGNFLAFGNTLTGEIAQMTFENNLASLNENGWEDKAQDFIDSFEAELNRRKK